MLTIDGSFGEGGGQILRSALAMAMVTGRAVRIEKIRAGRKKPGLMRQHLTAVKAAQEVCDAKVKGANIGSGELEFSPGAVKAGRYRFAVGTAGSGTLVLQTVMPALLMAREGSDLRIEGGTHNPWAPPFDFLARALLPVLATMGMKAAMTLERPGFYPAGGGAFDVRIEPAERMRPLELAERGEIVGRRARAVVSMLSEEIARRELDEVGRKMTWPAEAMAVETVTNPAGPGNVLMLEIESQNVTELFTGFGRVDVPARVVAAEAVEQARDYLAAGVPVGPYMADQLLLPLALAGGRFRTMPLTRHATTNIDLIGAFLPPEAGIVVRPVGEKVYDVMAAGMPRESAR